MVLGQVITGTLQKRPELAPGVVNGAVPARGPPGTWGAPAWSEVKPDQTHYQKPEKPQETRKNIKKPSLETGFGIYENWRIWRYPYLLDRMMFMMTSNGGLLG